MVRVHMVGGTSFEVDKPFNSIWEYIKAVNVEGWAVFEDRNGNGHEVQIKYVTHMQEVQI